MSINEGLLYSFGGVYVYFKCFVFYSVIWMQHTALMAQIPHVPYMQSHYRPASVPALSPSLLA